jgi:L-fucose mutarotase/ribose pyranase (RbsD/FucU family)
MSILHVFSTELDVSHALLQDRVDSDRTRDLHVPAYDAVREVVAKNHTDGSSSSSSPAPGVTLVERFEFYALARTSFCVVQTNDNTPYGNIIATKGVIFPAADRERE